MAHCAKSIDHYCKTECESSGKDVPLEMSNTRAGGTGNNDGRLSSWYRLLPIFSNKKKTKFESEQTFHTNLRVDLLM